MKEKKDKLYIAIDPGFAAYKIIINEKKITFSSKMLDVTNATYGADRRPKGAYYVQIEEKRADGKLAYHDYLIGDVCETSMSSADTVKNNKHLLEILQTLSKFSSEPFKISLQGALALALYIYQESKENTIGFTIEALNNGLYDVYIGMALPHDYVGEYASVKPHLACKHDFKLYIADENVAIPIEYDLSEAHYMVDSQVKCAFLYQFTDDEGNDVSDFMEHLPCFVVDGGYHTFGMFYLTKDFTTPICESNLDFAMYTVDKNVAAEVSERIQRINFTPLQVKQFINNKQPIRYGASRIENEELYQIYDRQRRTIASTSINTMEKIVELNDCNCLLLTGGTGAAYFDVYKEYFKEHYGDNLVPILTDKPFKNEKIEPVYAVALGLYKEVLNAVATAEEEA